MFDSGGKPLIGDEDFDNDSEANGDDDFSTLGFCGTDFPCVSCCFVERCFGRRPIDVDDDCAVLKICRFGVVFVDDFLSMHCAELIASRAGDSIRQSGIGIDQRRFDFVRGLVVESVSMDDVSDIESSRPNFVNSFELLVRFVGADLRADVSENAIAFPLANVERLAIARIDQ